MEFLRQIELFSRTFDNRFVFSLFDLLLCGVIVLVIVRGSSRHAGVAETRNRFFLLLAFSCLGGSFALGAIFTGSYFFFHHLLPEVAFDLCIHALRASAWMMLIASALNRPLRHSATTERAARWSSLPVRLVVGLWLLVGGLILAAVWTGGAESLAGLHQRVNRLLDWLNPVLLAMALYLFHRRPLGKHNFAMIALAILLVAAFLHISPADARGNLSVIIWNLEQFTWSLALFTFALAIGETSDDLFYRVFVGLQVTFILLASVMILVITQTEKTEYLASLRSRSNELAEFVRANVDYLSEQGEALPAVVEREDFLQRATWGFGHLPELRIVRIALGGEVATFEIADDGEIHQKLEPFHSTAALAPLNADEYFLMHALPLAEAGPGSVEFYGAREYLDRHVRKRIVIIFTLFTGIVILSTLMIGLVVRGASITIQQQAREIEQAQQQLMQASKLAAIGQLAAGVAHEINNPATTILSRASFLLSDNGHQRPASDSEDLEAIVTQAQRIAHITRDLLQFSRPQVRPAKPVPMERVIDKSLRLIDPSLSAHHIHVEKSWPAQLPRVLANEESLSRALENLFRNAVDAMPDGGVLRIVAAAEARDHQLRLEIADTGLGIPPEHLARIFDPFFTTKEVGKGTGLGLSIVHGTINEHQGTITVESEPGKGTRFRLILPTEE